MAASSKLETSSSRLARGLVLAFALATAAGCGRGGKHSGSSTTGATGGGTTGGTTGGDAALVSIEVLPAAPTVAKGLTQELTATGHFADGSTQLLSTTVVWTTDAAAVASLDGAVVKGMAVGSSDVHATVGEITGSVTVTVGPPVVTAVTLSPPAAALAAGTTLAYEAAAILSDGTKEDVTASAAWASSPATVTTVAAGGVATGLAVGVATVSATVAGVTASTSLRVTDAVLTAIELSPIDPVVPLGVVQPFTATGLFSDGSRQDLTAAVTWSTVDPGVATVAPSGTATPVAIGTTAVVAAVGGVSASSTLTVTDATLQSLAVDPPGASLAAGTSAAFTATGTYSDGSTQDLTALVTWSSTDAAVATVSDGGATAVAPGAATIRASLLGLSAGADVTVTSAILVSLAVSPPSPTLPKGLVQPLVATGTFSDGSTQDLTAVSAWTSSLTTVAAVSNAAGEEGQVTAVDAGTATITAAYGAVSGSTDVTVSEAAVVSIDVSPATTVVPVGYTQPFRAVATWSDGSSRDVTAEVTWSSSDRTAATISNSAGSQGIATGLAASAAPVQIAASLPTSSGTPVVGTADLGVVSASLQSIAVSPSAFTVGRRATVRLVALGTFSDGQVLDVTRQCTWSSSSRGVATVSKAGVVTGVALGPVVIKAKKGNRSGTASGTVY